MTVIESPHVTVIIRHGTNEEVKRFDTNVSFAQALRAYAAEIGADPETVKSSAYGARLSVPGVGSFRATFRRT